MVSDVEHLGDASNLIYGVITLLLGVIIGHNFTLNVRAEKVIDDVPFNLTGSGVFQEVTSFDL